MKRKNSDDLLNELENELSMDEKISKDGSEIEELKKQGLYADKISNDYLKSSENEMDSNDDELNELMKDDPEYQKNLIKKQEEDKIFNELKFLYDNYFDIMKINSLQILDSEIIKLKEKIEKLKCKKSKEFLKDKLILFNKYKKELLTKLNESIIEPKEYLNMLNDLIKVNKKEIRLNINIKPHIKKNLENRILIISKEAEELRDFIKKEEESENNKKESIIEEKIEKKREKITENLKEIIFQDIKEESDNKEEKEKIVEEIGMKKKKKEKKEVKKEEEKEVEVKEEEKLKVNINKKDEIKKYCLENRRLYFSAIEYLFKSGLKEKRKDDILNFKKNMNYWDIILNYLDNNSSLNEENKKLLKNVNKFKIDMLLGESIEERNEKIDKILQKIKNEIKDLECNITKKMSLNENKKIIQDLMSIKNTKALIPNISKLEKKNKVNNYCKEVQKGCLLIKIHGIKSKFKHNFKLKVTYKNEEEFSHTTDTLKIYSSFKNINKPSDSFVFNISNEELNKDFFKGQLTFTIEKTKLLFFSSVRESFMGNLRKFAEGGCSYIEDIDFIHKKHELTLRYEAFISRGFKIKYNIYNVYRLNKIEIFSISDNPLALNYKKTIKKEENSNIENENNKKTNDNNNDNQNKPNKFKITSLKTFEEANNLLKKNNIKINLEDNNYGYFLKDNMFDSILELKEKINNGNDIELKIFINKYYKNNFKKILDLCQSIEEGIIDPEEHLKNLKNGINLDRNILIILTKQKEKFKEPIQFVKDRIEIIDVEIKDISSMV